MPDVVDVPIEDGRRPAEEVTVEVDEDGMPPARVEVGGQQFDLEPVAGKGPPWVYRRSTTAAG